MIYKTVTKRLCFIMAIAGIGLRTILVGGAALVAAGEFIAHANAQQGDVKFQNFIQTQIWPKAQAAGIDRGTFDKAFANVKTPDVSILKSAAGQPEFASTVQSYVKKRVSDLRVRNGLNELEKDSVRNALSKIGRDYNVDPYIVLSIWGMESSYGAALKGDTLKDIFRSMATLAYADPKRKQFGMENVIAALTIVKKKQADVDEMVGSWAGGMGHTQFIPTSYLQYAQDLNGDGHFDIWANVGDALASAANHLATAPKGSNAPVWHDGEPWGVEVVLPQNFNFKYAFANGTFAERSLTEWQNMGIRAANGSGLPLTQQDTTLYMPSGANGPIFLLYHNFEVIKRYNKSNSYALAVGLLADRLAGKQEPIRNWPSDKNQLTRVEDIRRIQMHLNQKGFYDGKIDGFPGPKLMAAVSAFQSRLGIYPPDGLATQRILNEIAAQ